MRTRLPLLLTAILGLALTFTWTMIARDLEANTAFAQTVSHTVRLNLNVSDPNLDPALALDLPSFFVINQLFMGLTRVDDETGDILPDLATSWQASPDADVFTFTLRSDVTWSDGTPVTADDVRYGILRSLTPETGAPFVNYLFVIQAAESYYNHEMDLESMIAAGGIQVIDNTHMMFVLNEPTAHFPSLMALPIVRAMPADAIESFGASWTEVGNIVTNGPYQLGSWTHGTSLRLDKNPNHPATANVQIDQVLFSIVDEDTAWEMYLDGELDSVIVPRDRWSAAQNDPILQGELHAAPSWCTVFYGFNTAKAPFGEYRVRKAFIASIDRQFVIDGLLGYAQQPALTFAPSGVFGHVDGVSEGVGIPYDLAQAQLWLGEAGYPNGLGLPDITLAYPAFPDGNAIAAYAQQRWIHDLGADIILNPMDFGDFLDLMKINPPQIWGLWWCGDYSDAHAFLFDFVYGYQSGIFGNWNDTAYLGYLNQASKAADPGERWPIYKQAEEVLVEDQAVMFPIYYDSKGIATRPYLVRTYGNSGRGGDSGYIADWSIAQQVFLPIVLNRE